MEVELTVEEADAAVVSAGSFLVKAIESLFHDTTNRATRPVLAGAVNTLVKAVERQVKTKLKALVPPMKIKPEQETWLRKWAPTLDTMEHVRWLLEELDAVRAAFALRGNDLEKALVDNTELRGKLLRRVEDAEASLLSTRTEVDNRYKILEKAAIEFMSATRAASNAEASAGSEVEQRYLQAERVLEEVLMGNPCCYGKVMTPNEHSEDCKNYLPPRRPRWPGWTGWETGDSTMENGLPFFP